MKSAAQQKAYEEQVEARNKFKASKKADSERRARTRSLIQLGGLVNVSGLSDFFDITLGDDLQGELVGNHKAARLLGALLELNSLLNNKSGVDKKIKQWQEVGFKILVERKNGKK